MSGQCVPVVVCVACDDPGASIVHQEYDAEGVVLLCAGCVAWLVEGAVSLSGRLL